MSDKTHISWTDATWNPITGCSLVSPGCTNCYAMKLAGTRLQHHPSRAGLTTMSKAGPVWNGQVRLNEAWMDQPLRWSRPRMIFVCAHGDLFHEDVPDAWIDRVFAVMAQAGRHTFQVLTKRSQRMRTYLNGVVERQRDMACDSGLDFVDFPLPNVWLGVSAENQYWADRRIPDLLVTPAAIRFLSAEPLLGELDLEPYLLPVRQWSNAWLNNYPYNYPKHRLDQVIVGGENGPRPMHPDWARSLRDQCAAAEKAFFFKQWGSWAPSWGGSQHILGSDGTLIAATHDDPRAWRDRTHEPMARIGKKAAGDLLDGVQHHNWPITAKAVV